MTAVPTPARSEPLTDARDEWPVRLTPGAVVSNLRGVLEARPERRPTGLGTLGFLALRNGRRQREVVLISNRHVLLAQGARRGDAIYCPRITRRGEDHVIRRDALEPIAEILDEGVEDNTPFHYPAEPSSEYFVDCASARLVDQQAVQPPMFAVRAADALRARAVGRLHPLDVVGGRTVRVRKLGGASGVTTGRVLDAAATVDVARQPRRFNNIVIRGIGGRFAEDGDSGALVVDEQGRAIGLLWGCSQSDSDLAFACHIHPVLHRLDVTMVLRGFA